MSKNLCRFCMSQESNIISVFNNERKLIEKSKICLGIEVRWVFTSKQIFIYF